MVSSHIIFCVVFLRLVGANGTEQLGRIFSMVWIVGQCLDSSHSLVYVSFIYSYVINISEVWRNLLVRPDLACVFIKSNCKSFVIDLGYDYDDDKPATPCPA